jgi:hypothetical protein
VLSSTGRELGSRDLLHEHTNLIAGELLPALKDPKMPTGRLNLLPKSFCFLEFIIAK